MAATLSQSQQVAAAQQQAQTARTQIIGMQAQAVAFATALWASYKIHNDVSMASFLERWLPVLQGAESAIGQVTQSYLNASVQALSGSTYQAVPVASELFTGSILRNGASPTSVYQRPFIQFYSDLSKDKPIPQALASAEARLRTMASADLQLAHTHAARATFQSIPQGARVTGYRRVIGDDRPCELCVTAAGQRYKTNGLMPIHNNCHCTVWPIIGTKDLGQRVNIVALTDNPPSADNTKFFGQAVKIHTHGEMGPILTAGGNNFMSQSEAMARTASKSAS